MTATAAPRRRASNALARTTLVATARDRRRRPEALRGPHADVLAAVPHPMSSR